MHRFDPLPLEETPPENRMWDVTGRIHEHGGGPLALEPPEEVTPFGFLYAPDATRAKLRFVRLLRHPEELRDGEDFDPCCEQSLEDNPFTGLKARFTPRCRIHDYHELEDCHA